MQASDFFDKETSLMVDAISNHELMAAKEYIDSGIELNQHGKDGITPLIWLVMNKDLKAVELALDLGADPDFTSGDGDTVISLVAGGNNDELVNILIEYGADPDSVNRNGDPTLFAVIAYKKKAQFDALLKAGADIDKVDRTNTTSLVYAGELLKFDMVCLLLNNGADHTIRDSTDGDIAWAIHEAIDEGIINSDSDQYVWLIEAKNILVDRGVEFPPLSPDQVRIKEGRPNQWDLKTMGKESQ